MQKEPKRDLDVSPFDIEVRDGSIALEVTKFGPPLGRRFQHDDPVQDIPRTDNAIVEDEPRNPIGPNSKHGPKVWDEVLGDSRDNIGLGVGLIQELQTV